MIVVYVAFEIRCNFFQVGPAMKKRTSKSDLKRKYEISFLFEQ